MSDRQPSMGDLGVRAVVARAVTAALLTAAVLVSLLSRRADDDCDDGVPSDDYRHAGQNTPRWRPVPLWQYHVEGACWRDFDEAETLATEAAFEQWLMDYDEPVLVRADGHEQASHMDFDAQIQTMHGGTRRIRRLYRDPTT